MTAATAPDRMNAWCQPTPSMTAPIVGAEMATPALRKEPCHPMTLPRLLGGVRLVSWSILAVRVGETNRPPISRMKPAYRGEVARVVAAAVRPMRVSRTGMGTERFNAP